ncbi:MAG: DUF554 domain-containing protein [Deltaproteobacteria bacterium]|nr:DUF554 domain-containing protein [Deltaproteobacteria bacterium]
MIGTFVNTGAILAGSIIGISAGKYLPERIKMIIMQALGLSVVLIGLKMALSGTAPIVTIGCVLIGALTGELMKIEQGVEHLGEWIKLRVRSHSSTFVQGFVSASILYLTGAMMIVGSILDGTVGDADILYIKSLLDGVASIALSSTLGIGVSFSALSVLIVQGSITLLASHILFLQKPAVLEAVTASGGLLIVGIGTNLLGITKIRIGNFLPALLFAILWATFA